MVIKRIENFDSSIASKSLFGLLLKKGEKNRLYDMCIKYGIEITYPNLFADDTHYYLWGIRENSIGLIGTVIMNYLQDNGTIFQSLDELEDYLKGE